MSSAPLLERARGVTLGAIFGDCLGAEFDCMLGEQPLGDVLEYFNDVLNNVKDCHTGTGSLLYTDDSCMTFDLGHSLIKHGGFKAPAVAKTFCETYFSSFQRFYGSNVVDVFVKLKHSNYSDVYGPASQQFGGSGSYGNGSAMRVSPVTLLHHNDVPSIVKLADEKSRITHTHPLGISGAILQALAIEKALSTNEIESPVIFCQELLEQFKEYTAGTEGIVVYEAKMNKIIEILRQEELAKPQTVNSKIGSGVTAHEAVPAAIFSFLYCLDRERLPLISDYNGMLRTAFYSVSFSYDSDTVGSMATAIAGAYYGENCIPDEWKIACEGADAAMKMANDLINLNMQQQ